MLDLTPKSAATIRPRSSFESRQPRRLLMALVLLVVALGVLLFRDRDFWFGDGELLDASAASTHAAKPVARTPEGAQPASSPAKSATPAINPQPSKTTTAPAAKAKPAKAQTPGAQPANTPNVAAVRTVLPPLDVEVIAGDKHRDVHPGSNALKVEISNAASVARQAAPQSAAKMEVASNAVERTPLATATLQSSNATVNTPYPMLAQQMKVQGSVVLRALVGADGVIQNVHVLSGPAILTSAAQQAVRQWRFKPVIQNGQAVETQATITVNFTIRVTDDAPRTTWQAQGGY